MTGLGLKFSSERCQLKARFPRQVSSSVSSSFHRLSIPNWSMAQSATSSNACDQRAWIRYLSTAPESRSTRRHVFLHRPKSKFGALGAYPAKKVLHRVCEPGQLAVFEPGSVDLVLGVMDLVTGFEHRKTQEWMEQLPAEELSPLLIRMMKRTCFCQREIQKRSTLIG